MRENLKFCIHHQMLLSLAVRSNDHIILQTSNLPYVSQEWLKEKKIFVELKVTWKRILVEPRVTWERILK